MFSGMTPNRAFTELAVAIKRTGQPICQTTDPDLWFPEQGDGSRGSVRQAKKWCKECPVQMECLAYAVANREAFGIWGGLTVEERSKMNSRSVGRPRKVI
jgi:WhiB family redox-sensing transcriptional regulator